MTQDEIAEKLGTATRALQRIEAGQNLTLHTLARIAAVLGVRPEDLVATEPLSSRVRRYDTPPPETTRAVAEHPKRHGREGG